MRGKPLKKNRVGIMVLASLTSVSLLGVPAGGQANPPIGGMRRGRIGPAYWTTGNGRRLRPEGRMTQVGDLPTGGALTRDGRFYWAVDSGHGQNDVRVVDVTTGAVVQVLPLPGAYGGIAFSPDGATAYVSGEPRGRSTPSGPTVANAGDAVHVFAVDAISGRGTESPPIQLPPTSGGTAQTQGGPLGWPEGLNVTPDGRRLLVALNQADALAIVDLADPAHPTRLVHVGRFPYGVAADPDGLRAYVSNELDGTVSVVDLAAGSVVASIGVGGTKGDLEAHPEALIADPHRHLLYVAVTSRDLVEVIDTSTRTVVHSVSVARQNTLGTAPVGLALSPDGTTLYVADSGEDAIAAISLTERSRHGDRDRGAIPGLRAFELIGRLPTAAYPSAVAVTPDGRRLVWLAAKGLGAGPNPDYGVHWANSGAAPYGSYVIDKLLGDVGVLGRPTDRMMRRLTRLADDQVRPALKRWFGESWLSWFVESLLTGAGVADRHRAPVDTPVQGRDGGPSHQIKHVFYVVRENRTYDQIFGSVPRGDGDPSLEVVDDNGRPGPAGGVTPNAHSLARTFPLLDHFYADSEVSTDGHVITSSSYAIDFVQKALHADYSGRGRVNNAGEFPETFPPNAFVFDQAVRQNVSFRNFGEFSAGVTDDGRPTFPAVHAGQDFGYPFRFGCDGTYPNFACSTDSGHPGQVGDPATSRFDYFQQRFNDWLAGGADQVPSLVYLTLPNDHTNGVAAGKPTPKALIADNDLGLGQLVQLISHSPIWHDSAIFVVEDDSQDGADHVDAHRMPAFVISPYARRGAVIHNRYDQYSVIRTIGLMLGMRPLSLFDSLAAPMYEAFSTRPDNTPYDAIQPEQPLDERPPPMQAAASTRGTTRGTTTTVTFGGNSDARGLADQLPFDQVDLVPQALSDDVLWHSVYGWSSTPPTPGPGASQAEELRARVAVEAYARQRDIAKALQGMSAPDAAG